MKNKVYLKMFISLIVMLFIIACLPKETLAVSKKTAITKCTVSSISNRAYTGKAIKPGVTVKYKGKKLKLNTDYTLSYSNNTKVGTAKVTIKGKGNYSGKRTKTFKIVKKNISKCTISEISNRAYTGKAIKPGLTIKNGSITLKSGKNYTVKYSNNKNLGTAKITIKGKGNYSGSITKKFKIVIGRVSNVNIDSSRLSSSNLATLSWKKASGSIDGYQIYMSTNGGNYSKIKTITNGNTVSYKKTNLESGNTYSFKIRSYKKISNKYYYSSFSDIVGVFHTGTIVIAPTYPDTTTAVEIEDIENTPVTEENIISENTSTDNTTIEKSENSITIEENTTVTEEIEDTENVTVVEENEITTEEETTTIEENIDSESEDIDYSDRALTSYMVRNTEKEEEAVNIIKEHMAENEFTVEFGGTCRSATSDEEAEKVKSNKSCSSYNSNNLYSIGTSDTMGTVVIEVYDVYTYDSTGKNANLSDCLIYKMYLD